MSYILTSRTLKVLNYIYLAARKIDFVSLYFFITLNLNSTTLKNFQYTHNHKLNKQLFMLISCLVIELIMPSVVINDHNLP